MGANCALNNQPGLNEIFRLMIAPSIVFEHLNKVTL
jgi:hypothetical protein